MSHKIIQLVRKFAGGVIAPVNAVFANEFTTNTSGCSVSEGKLLVEHGVTEVVLEATFPVNNVGSTPSFLIKGNTLPSADGPSNLSGWKVIGKGSAINATHKSTFTLNINDENNGIVYGVGICAFVLQKATVTQTDPIEV